MSACGELMETLQNFILWRAEIHFRDKHLSMNNFDAFVSENCKDKTTSLRQDVRVISQELFYTLPSVQASQIYVSHYNLLAALHDFAAALSQAQSVHIAHGCSSASEHETVVLVRQSYLTALVIIACCMSGVCLHSCIHTHSTPSSSCGKLVSQTHTRTLRCKATCKVADTYALPILHHHDVAYTQGHHLVYDTNICSFLGVFVYIVVCVCDAAVL